jgi:signal transduction histidine kinase
VLTPSDFSDAVGAIADYLSSRKDAILAAWAAAARRDPELTAPLTLSRAQFFDHIPQMLEALVHKLRASYLGEALEAQRDEIENAEGHGIQRWQQGYNEAEVMREWIWLNACIADELEAFALNHPDVDQRAMSAAWRLVSEFTVRGMSESVGEYSRLLRTEAAGRVRSLQEAMQRLNEMELQRATFWREAAHDLRGNVSVVRNVSEMLRHTVRDGGAAAMSLEMLERTVTSLHALLDDLTAQARLDAGQEMREIRPFDAAVVLRELGTTREPVARERGLFLRCEGPESLPVEGDEIKVRRIAQNLLHNALMYTREGGVRMTWEQLEQLPKRWMLCVEDTGPGLATKRAAPLSAAIESATRDSLTAQADASMAASASPPQPPAPTLPSLSSSTSQAHGEGVGLSIVKRLCELLDASIELQTAPGKGTTFRVTFPRQYPKG